MTRVSVGLPVYNGARHLEQTLDSLLAQTHEDLDVLVVDNCSTDASRAVAERVAARDSRVRVVGNATNIGAVRNFNRAFVETAGELFLWAADHDLYYPTYVAACVAMLADPDVVLAYTGAHFIGDDGSPHEQIRSVVDTRGLDQTSRLSAVLWGLGPYSYAIYGVMRRSALRRLQHYPDIYPTTIAPDVVMLAELALVGAFAWDPSVLFTQRRLPDHGSWDAGLEKLGVRPRTPGQAARLYAGMCGRLAASVRHHVAEPIDRAAALASVAGSLATTYRWIPRGLWTHARHDARGRP